MQALGSLPALLKQGNHRLACWISLAPLWNSILLHAWLSQTFSQIHWGLDWALFSGILLFLLALTKAFPQVWTLVVLSLVVSPYAMLGIIFGDLLQNIPWFMTLGFASLTLQGWSSFFGWYFLFLSFYQVWIFHLLQSKKIPLEGDKASPDPALPPDQWIGFGVLASIGIWVAFLAFSETNPIRLLLMLSSLVVSDLKTLVHRDNFGLPIMLLVPFLDTEIKKLEKYVKSPESHVGKLSSTKAQKLSIADARHIIPLNIWPDNHKSRYEAYLKDHGKPKPKYAWHGNSSVAGTNSIASLGFINNNLVGARYGPGIYLTSQAYYSLWYVPSCNPPPSSKMLKKD
jgi:hypothetical protein